MRGTTLRVVLAGLIGLLMALTGLAVAPPGHAAGTGSVSGTVQVPPGYDVRAVRVIVTPEATPLSWHNAPAVWANADGTFEVTGVAPGEHHIAFATYWSDISPCNGRDRWWSGPGQVPAGVCANGALTGASTVAVAADAETEIGTSSLLTGFALDEFSGTVAAPPGHSTAGVQAELWIHDPGAWGILGGWYRLESVPTQTLTATGEFSFDLIHGSWSDGYAVRIVDAATVGYAFSFGTGGLTRDSEGANGASFGPGSVGLLRLPLVGHDPVDVGVHQLKFETTRVSGGVTLSGTPEWGRTLTASNDVVWSDPGVVTTYQWYRNGVALDGVTGPTYVLDAIEDGFETPISVRAVPAGAWAWNGTPIEAGPLVIENTTPLNLTGPSIAGTLAVGRTLAARAGSWRPAAVTFTHTYQWFRGTTPIAGATGRQYVVRAADLGKRLAVEVRADRATDCGHCTPWFTGPGSARSTPSAVVARGTVLTSWILRWPGKVISAVPKVRGRVGIGVPTYSAAGRAQGLRASYRWYVGGRAVAGATSRVLTIKRAWKGRTVAVTVTISGPGLVSRARTVSYGRVR